MAFLLVPTDWFLFKTKAGLRVLPAARNRKRRKPSASTWRSTATPWSSSLGCWPRSAAPTSIGDLSQFTTNITAGRGFIALAAVIFGNWMPWATMGAALLFGFAQALRFHVQALDLPIPQDLIIALPYLLTLIAITGLLRRSTPPAGLGRHPTGGDG